MANRKQVCAEARSWLGTPFLHQARVKKLGVDCVGLVLSVAEDLKFNDKNGAPLGRQDHAGYTSQPVATYVLDTCRTRLIQKPITQMKPGDVICLRCPTNPTHTAFVVDGERGSLHMVHAYDGGSRKCIEHVIDHRWQNRIVAAFELPGIEE